MTAKPRRWCPLWPRTCIYVADAVDPGVARKEVSELIVRLLEGLRTRPNAVATELAGATA